MPPHAAPTPMPALKELIEPTMPVAAFERLPVLIRKRAVLQHAGNLSP